MALQPPFPPQASLVPYSAFRTPHSALSDGWLAAVAAARGMLLRFEHLPGLVQAALHGALGDPVRHQPVADDAERPADDAVVEHPTELRAPLLLGDGLGQRAAQDAGDA